MPLVFCKLEKPTGGLLREIISSHAISLNDLPKQHLLLLLLGTLVQPPRGISCSPDLGTVLSDHAGGDTIGL